MRLVDIKQVVIILVVVLVLVLCVAGVQRGVCTKCSQYDVSPGRRVYFVHSVLCSSVSVSTGGQAHTPPPTGAGAWAHCLLMLGDSLSPGAPIPSVSEASEC